MASSVDKFNIDDNELFNDDIDKCLESKVKGFVLHVEQCQYHDHFVHLHSEGKSEYVSDANTDISTGANLNVTVGANHLAAITGNREASVVGNANETVGGSVVENVGGDLITNIGGSVEFSVSGNRSETVTGDMDLSADNLTLNAAVHVKYELPANGIPAALLDCITNNTIDLNKLANWLKMWSDAIDARLSTVESSI